MFRSRSEKLFCAWNRTYAICIYTSIYHKQQAGDIQNSFFLYENSPKGKQMEI